jgi:hypothetical protein
MIERNDLNSDRELPDGTSVEIVSLEQINAQLAVRIEEVERRSRELRERINQTIPEERQTIYIDPAIGE